MSGLSCFAPFKGIGIPESRKFLPVESGILEILLVESGILSLGIRNTAVGIQNLTNNWNSE